MPRRPDMPCSGCGKLMYRGRGVLPEGQATCHPCRRLRPGYRDRAAERAPQRWTCGHCGKACERPATRGQRPKWCGPQCANDAAWERALAKLAPRSCTRCSAEYAPTWPHQKFCSTTCSNMLTVRERAERRAAKAAAGVTGARVWIQGPCAHCGTIFAPVPGGTYCSSRCRAKGTGRDGSKWISAAKRVLIYKRDGWSCQICGEAMSREYAATDPWAPTLDHIVPRSQGGSDDVENLRSAHAWCNSVRSDGSYYTEDDLAGVLG